MPGAASTTSPHDVHGVLFPRVQCCDLVFVHGQRPVVSGVCFACDQGPGLVEGARGEDRVGEGDEADAGRRGSEGRGEAKEAGGGDEEGGRGAGEGVGGHVAFGGLGPGGVGTDPGHAVESGAPHLPAGRVQFEADGAA